MAHDQLFKELLQAFFREFMELFFAEVAARLDFSRVTFLDKETFTDLAQGKQREADLVVQVYTREGQPEIILTHIEVEARRRGTFPKRMFDYYMMLRLRHRLPIYPIVVYLSRGTGGLTVEQYEERIFDQPVNVFTYQAVGLPDLKAEDYQERENPLGPALSALMRRSRVDKLAQKYQILRATATSEIDEARKALLTNVIETYLKLNEEEQTEFEALMAQPEGAEVRQMISIYEQRGIEKGMAEGLARGKREALLRMMQRKFGTLPEGVESRVEAVTDSEELDRLMDRLWTAETLEQMGLAERPESDR